VKEKYGSRKMGAQGTMGRGKRVGGLCGGER